MRATKLVGEPQERSFGPSLVQESFVWYERRLIRWGCPMCRFFEKRVFKSGLPHEELDAYIICRYDEDLMDLLGEVPDCPKNCRPELPKNKSESGSRRLHCVHRA